MLSCLFLKGKKLNFKLWIFEFYGYFYDSILIFLLFEDLNRFFFYI